MKINEYDSMMRYLTRPGKVLANNINDKKIPDTDARTPLKKGSSDTKVMPKKSKVMDYINDNIAMYEPENATKEQLEGLEKRLKNARAFVTPPKRRDTWKEFVASGGKELPKLSPEEIKKVQGDRKVRDYMLRDYRAEKPKPIKPDLVNGHSDWNTDDWLESIDPGGWASPEDEGKRRSGILEFDLATEYWQGQYQNYQNNGGTLSYPQFMQQQLNNKVSKKINKIVEEKKESEGIASILALHPDRV